MNLPCARIPRLTGIASLAAACLVAACGGDTPPHDTAAEDAPAAGSIPVSAPVTEPGSALTPALAPALTPAQPLPAGPARLLATYRARLADLHERIDLALRQLYLDGTGQPLDATLTFPNASISFDAFPILSDRVKIPLARGRGGRVMAYAYEYPDGQRGRGLVYGADVLSWMSLGSQQIQHRPMFRQAWRWALTPGAGPLNYVNHGHDAGTIEKFITGQLDRAAVPVACDLTAAALAASCQGASVFVIGGAITEDVAVRQRLIANLRSLLALGKTVMYFAPTAWDNTRAGTNALIDGLTDAGPVRGPGNYFACPDACVAVPPGNFAQLHEAYNWTDDWLALTDMLAGTAAVPDVTANPKAIQLIEWSHQALGKVRDPIGSVTEPQGREQMLEPLADWADAWRPQIVYGATIDQSVDRLAFLRAYASDSWINHNRAGTTVPPQGAGSYTPATASTGLKPSAEFEEIAVTIPQAVGITLIGRAAVPGKRVEIEVVDPAHSSALSIQTSYLRSWDQPLARDAANPARVRYNSPRRPGSWPVALKPGLARHFVTPFGGPLMLIHAGAQPGDVVRLRIRGAAPYAHLDFTQPSPVTDAQIDEMTARVGQDALGWMTFKFVGGEVQQKVELSRWLWATRGMADYLRHALPDDLFQVNHRSNGYNNVARSATVTALCNAFQWDCTSNLHKAPGVQHFVGWIASCGSMCSGQPVDAFGGFGAGWGTAHELGHNTVQRVHTMSFTEPDFDTGAVVTKGCFVECNNNILSVVTGLAAWARDGTNIGTGRVGTRILYNDVLVPAQAEAARLGLSADKARQLTGTRLWTQGVDRARWGLHFQLGALYAKYRHPDSPKVEREMLFDFLALLTMGDRLVKSDWSPDKAGRYAMGRYASNTIGNQDLIYALSSKVIGRDLRRIFALYGVPLSVAALDSVADLALPVAPLSFYAFPDYAPAQGVWLDLETTPWPAYPFAS
ncbi:ImpA family metalloprotease [Leptothrix sp. BB-3]